MLIDMSSSVDAAGARQILRSQPDPLPMHPGIKYIARSPCCDHIADITKLSKKQNCNTPRGTIQPTAFLQKRPKEHSQDALENNF